jgi:hypothetical protein
LVLIPSAQIGGHTSAAHGGLLALPAKWVVPVTVVTQDPAALGATAAQMLFARIEGDGAPPRTLEMRTRLIVRGSGEIRVPPDAV